VKQGGARKESSAPLVMISEAFPYLSLEELEQRLESCLVQLVRTGPCNCLGELCQCDGQDCAGVCANYCLIHYL
jgi:hypothetical protein